MIQEILRSSLILGTVAVNAISLGHPGTTANPTPQPAQQPTPATQPITRESTTVLPTAASLTTIQRFDAHLPKLPKLPKQFHLRNVTTGLATWYGKVRDGHRTANGEFFDSTLLTAANNSLPFGTRVKVTNLKNGQSVIVRVNDRGVLSPGNIIDITSAAADKIGMLRMGIAPVHLDILAGAA
jgi:rare lipoprotein A